MQTLKNLFMITSNRTWRGGLKPAAIIIKANLCHKLFWLNCKYSNTLRSKYDEKDQTCQLSLMQSIARSISQT